MKRYYVLLTVLAVIILLCSCRSGNSQLPNQLKSQDGKVIIDTPENWSVYEAEAKDNLVLTVQDGAGAFVQVFWFPGIEGKTFTAKDYADKAIQYYGEDAKSSLKSIKAENNPTDANTIYYFAYQKQGLDKDGNSYTYKGYEYFLPQANGVAEVDVFYRYTDTEPTNDQLTLLSAIAQTVQIRG